MKYTAKLLSSSQTTEIGIQSLFFHILCSFTDFAGKENLPKPKL